MSTVLANPAEMMKQGAPHLIHNDEELAEYTQALFELTAKADPTLEEEEAIDLKTLLVERYVKHSQSPHRYGFTVAPEPLEDEVTDIEPSQQE